MTKRERAINETDLYPTVRDFLKLEHDCSAVCADIPDDEYKVRVPRNLKEREIDVVGIEYPEGEQPCVHLCEGKRFSKGQAFEDAINQLGAVREWGDVLWIFVPKIEWLALTEDDKRQNRQLIKKHNFGLLLVDLVRKRCEEEVRPPRRNSDVVPAKRNEVIKQMGQGSRFLPSVRSMGSLEARRAAENLHLMGIVEASVEEMTRKKVDYKLWRDDADAIEHDYFVHHLDITDYVEIDFDVFGRFLDNGVPAVWVWYYLKPPSSASKLADILKEADFFGSHLMLDNDAWDWRIIPISSSTQEIDYWWKQGLRKVIYVGQRIEINGRHLDSVQEELRRAIAAPRRFEKRF